MQVTISKDIFRKVCHFICRIIDSRRGSADSYAGTVVLVSDQGKDSGYALTWWHNFDPDHGLPQFSDDRKLDDIWLVPRWGDILDKSMRRPVVVVGRWSNRNQDFAVLKIPRSVIIEFQMKPSSISYAIHPGMRLLLVAFQRPGELIEADQISVKVTESSEVSKTLSGGQQVFELESTDPARKIPWDVGASGGGCFEPTGGVLLGLASLVMPNETGSHQYRGYGVPWSVVAKTWTKLEDYCHVVRLPPPNGETHILRESYLNDLFETSARLSLGGVDPYDYPHKIADLGRREPDRWREVVLSAGAKAAKAAPSAMWSLVEALCFREPEKLKEAAAEDVWGAHLAGMLLAETADLKKVSERNKATLDKVRRWLVWVLGKSSLPSVERVVAGNSLAKLGDPRFRADAWYLPKDDLLGFVEVSAGPFLMGSDRKKDWEAGDEETPQHTIELPKYYIGRYPVTVAQFRAFVKDKGYKPADPESLDGVENHPVVNVTWYEALAYCDWLAERLREWEDTPEALATLLRKGEAGGSPWRITLPSEAEWEKAARGTEGLVYPWGDEPDPSRANYDETGIGTTSSVGCFPGGASPYGCLDMAGNVWEWTRSLWGKDLMIHEFTYPYEPGKGREDLMAESNIRRVLRGGVFYGYLRDVRCASRIWDAPVDGGRNLGFRVVLSPFFPGF